jgi:Tfp pilus assembly protein PilV
VVVQLLIFVEHNCEEIMTPQRFILRLKAWRAALPAVRDERGFSIMEAAVAAVILGVGAVAVAAVATFATRYNSSSQDRAQAMAVAQQRMEQMRSARFTATSTDAILAGGTRQPEQFIALGRLNANGSVTNGRPYRVDVTVDDDPATAGIQVNTATLVKEIVVTVTPVSGGAPWGGSTAGQVRLTARRARL